MKTQTKILTVNTVKMATYTVKYSFFIPLGKCRATVMLFISSSILGISYEKVQRNIKSNNRCLL